MNAWDETDGWIFTDEANAWRRGRPPPWRAPEPLLNTHRESWTYRVGKVETRVETNLFSLRTPGECESGVLDRCPHRRGEDRHSYAADMFIMMFSELEDLEDRMERDGFPGDCLQLVLARKDNETGDAAGGHDHRRPWTSPDEYDTDRWLADCGRTGCRGYRGTIKHVVTEQSA